MRIVSLVPSRTELVWWLGRGEWLVGRTRFCVEPPEVREAVPVVGGTKNPRVERIAGLRPDLVLANREENRQEDVEALRVRGLEVLVTDPNSLEEALGMIEELGERLEVRGRASELLRESREEMDPTARGTGPRVFVAVWDRPLMGMGNETYGHSLLEWAGGRNVLAGERRYPDVSREELGALGPDLILLPDEPYRFGARHLEEFERIAPARLFDGKAMWWYGPRIPGALRTLRAALADYSR